MLFLFDRLCILENKPRNDVSHRLYGALANSGYTVPNAGVIVHNCMFGI